MEKVLMYWIFGFYYDSRLWCKKNEEAKDPDLI